MSQINKPEKMTVTEGDILSWCTCGKSAKNNGALCDGSHIGSDKRSLKVPMTKTGDVYICTCKHTKTPPYCDGSHRILSND